MVYQCKNFDAFNFPHEKQNTFYYSLWFCLSSVMKTLMYFYSSDMLPSSCIYLIFNNFVLHRLVITHLTTEWKQIIVGKSPRFTLDQKHKRSCRIGHLEKSIWVSNKFEDIGIYFIHHVKLLTKRIQKNHKYP